MKKYLNEETIFGAVTISVVLLAVQYLLTAIIAGRTQTAPFYWQFIVSVIAGISYILIRPATDAKLLIDTSGQKDIYRWVVDDISKLPEKGYLYVEVVHIEPHKELTE